MNMTQPDDAEYTEPVFSEQERAALCEERFEIWWSKQRPAYAGLPRREQITMWEHCRAAWYAAWDDSTRDRLFRTYLQNSREPAAAEKKTGGRRRKFPAAPGT